MGIFHCHVWLPEDTTFFNSGITNLDVVYVILENEPSSSRGLHRGSTHLSPWWCQVGKNTENDKALPEELKNSVPRPSNISLLAWCDLFCSRCLKDCFYQLAKYGPMLPTPSYSAFCFFFLPFFRLLISYWWFGILLRSAFAVFFGMCPIDGQDLFRFVTLLLSSSDPHLRRLEQWGDSSPMRFCWTF